MNRPLVSIVLCSFNGEKTIRRAIKSILNQTFKSFEFILIDDGSTDNTHNIMLEFDDLPNVEIFRMHKNKGLTQCLVYGVSISRGKYIARHDDDDWSEPRRIEYQVDALKRNPKIVLLGCIPKIWKGTHSYSQSVMSAYLTPFLIYSGNTIVHGTTMFLKDAYDEVGGYDIKFKYSQDYDLWLRFTKVGKIKILRKPLYNLQISKTSISNRHSQPQQTLAFFAIYKHFSDSRISFNKFLRLGEPQLARPRSNSLFQNLKILLHFSIRELRLKLRRD